MGGDDAVSGRTLDRRILLAAFVGAAAIAAPLLAPRFAWAGPASVPPEIQANLLSKLCSYDRAFAARAGTMARILIVVREGNPDSESAGHFMNGVLARLPQFAGLPHEQAIVAFSSGEALAARCRKEGIAVVYVAPGLDAQISGLRSSLAGVNVLSVAAVPDYVAGGVVIGFELVSGKPKILINLAQARGQHVDFPSSVLELMDVVVR
jgi:hypothetical protein